jgi:FKBP-type peptidyl-prolyl cis-trans isomerase SlyD
MQIEQNTVVSMHYTLSDDEGMVIDSSSGKEPLSFIFGTGTIIPGLEYALKGKIAGDSFTVTVPPEEGYGLYDEQRVVEVSRSQFQEGAEIEEGMQVEAGTEDGGAVMLVVTGVEGDQITLDGNHPLAGQNLNFQVTVEGVREATEEELSHGHVH